MKKCPFLTKKTRTEKWQPSPNQDNRNIVSDGTTTIMMSDGITTIYEEEEHTPCLGHECGAYYDRRCHYSKHKQL